MDRAGPTLAADSNTQFTMLTLATAMSWNGKARVQLNFIGANGAPFAIFGGGDCIVEILNDGGIWTRVNLGKAFVSNGNLDLASSHQMQLNDFGTIFSVNGKAYLLHKNGDLFPLFRVPYGSSRFAFLLFLFLVRVVVYLLLTKRLGGTVLANQLELKFLVPSLLLVVVLEMIRSHI